MRVLHALACSSSAPSPTGSSPAAIPSSRRYDAKADLWSVGAILYEVLVGRPPYNGQNPVQLLKNIETKEPKYPPSLSPACLGLMRSLLQRDPMQRLCFEDFFAHPFLTGHAPSPLPSPHASGLHASRPATGIMPPHARASAAALGLAPGPGGAPSNLANVPTPQVPDGSTASGGRVGGGLIAPPSGGGGGGGGGGGDAMDTAGQHEPAANVALQPSQAAQHQYHHYQHHHPPPPPPPPGAPAPAPAPVTAAASSAEAMAWIGRLCFRRGRGRAAAQPVCRPPVAGGCVPSADGLAAAR